MSLSVVVVTYATCYGLKRLASDASAGPSLALGLFIDFVTSVEFIVAAFELGIVLEHYGLAVWATCLYCSVTYQVQTMRLLRRTMYEQQKSSCFRSYSGKSSDFPCPLIG